jgi:aminoglycoside phosphotransferase (APT) family kinase protein
MPGMPHFMRPADVATTYRERSGHTPRSFEFYQVYAALRHGIVMCRVHDRRVHFGEAQRADDPDEPIFHRRTLERMIDGSWWQETSR